MNVHVYRVDKDGFIVGESIAQIQDVLANLKEGEDAVPYENDITPQSHKWDHGLKIWVKLPDPEVDWRDNRRGSMPPAHYQLELISDVLFAVCDRPEFKALVGDSLNERVNKLRDEIAAVKLKNPKGNSPP